MSKIVFNLSLKDETFKVQLDPKSRKNLNIRIKPNNVIHVSKPGLFSQKKLIKYLEDQEEWIVERSKKVNELFDNRQSLIDDESVIVFGERVLIKDNPRILKELDSMLMDYILSKRDYYDNLLKKKPLIQLRKMKARWGYCSPSENRLVFNKSLIHYPKDVIDYVILHEYAHLKIPNHSKEFYDFIEKDMPNYKDAIKHLKFN